LYACAEESLYCLAKWHKKQLSDLLKGHQKRYFQGVIVDGIRCNIYLQKLNENDYLFLIGSAYSKKLGEIYRKRWSIEVCFQSLKTRGFNLESSHLRDREKMKKNWFY
jgi:IS4 transposase